MVYFLGKRDAFLPKKKKKEKKERCTILLIIIRAILMGVPFKGFSEVL